jgi:6-pyruvoyl-tetrahydropterin synthase related domain
MSRRPSSQAVVSFVVVAAASLLVFFALHPSKVLLNTTPAGGDMGAHVWAPDYLRHHLFPHGRITGWSQDWYDGFPALTFYFPLPYVLIAALSYVLPYGIAFKLVSVSGLVGLPVAAWTFGKLAGMRFPGPPLLAVATVPFLFDRYWTIYGGNIASTMAGEFAFAISLCLALVFLGVFAQSLKTGRHRGLAASLLAATLLCHLLPTLFALVGAGLLWVLQPSRRRLFISLTVGAVAFALSAFWLLPFAVRLGYSNNMGWGRTVQYWKNLFPFLNHASDTPAAYTRHLKVVVALAGAGALGGIFLRRRATLVLTGMGLASAAAFRWMPTGALWNARMLPFWYLSLYLVAAAGVAEASEAVGVLLGRRPERLVAPPSPPAGYDAEPARALALVGGGVAREAASLAPPWSSTAMGAPTGPAYTEVPAWTGIPPGDGGPPWAEDRSDGSGGGGGGEDNGLTPHPLPGLLAPLIAALVVWLLVGQSIGAAPSWPRLAAVGDHNFVTDWANWNYSGYERKPAYPEYQDVVATMARVGQNYGCGRAMWEYESEEDRFGTPMALMLLPKWTNGCIGSMEGLFFESSATVPYHFLNQSELSKAPSDAMRDLPYEGLNVADGVAHLRMLGVRYYMAISPEAQAQARVTPGLRLIDTTSKPYDVTYTVSGVSKAQPRRWEIYEVSGADQVAPLSYEPAVMTGAPTTARGWINLSVAWYQNPNRWDVPLAASGPSDWPRVKGADPNPPRVAVRQTVVSKIVMADDRISFDVDQPGSPVVVRTSFFPNWQATGARGPWRITPNLMVVVPTSTHVSLHFGFTPVDNAGRLLTVAGIGAVGALAMGDRRNPDGDSGGQPDGHSDAPGATDPREADLDGELAALIVGDGRRPGQDGPDPGGSGADPSGFRPLA